MTDKPNNEGESAPWGCVAVVLLFAFWAIFKIFMLIYQWLDHTLGHSSD